MCSCYKIMASIAQKSLTIAPWKLCQRQKSQAHACSFDICAFHLLSSSRFSGRPSPSPISHLFTSTRHSTIDAADRRPTAAGSVQLKFLATIGRYRRHSISRYILFTMVMRRTICGLIGALSAFSGASAYGKIFDLDNVETWKAVEH